MKHLATAVTLAALLPLCASAETLEVAADGSAAYDSVTAALAIAAIGDTVDVAAGTYSSETSGEVFPLVVPPGVTLQGAGIDATVLDAAYGEGVITVSWTEGSPVTVSDLTLSGGEAPWDGEADALYLWQAEAVVERVAFVANGDPSIGDMPWNTDSWIDIRSSSLQLLDVDLSDNHGSNRGIRCSDGDMTLQRVRFTGNYVYYSLLDLRDACTGSLLDIHVTDNAGSNCDSALFTVGDAAAVNLVAAGNDVGPCRLWAGAELRHATVAGNRTHGTFPLLEVQRLGHSVVAFNEGTVALADGGEAVFNDVYGNEPADWSGTDPSGENGNLAVDPLFVSLEAEKRDLHLARQSPLLDAGGDHLTWPADIEGTERPLDGDGDGDALPDPGAYEMPFVPGDDDDDDDSSGAPADDDSSSAAAGEDDDDCSCSAARETGGRPVHLLALILAFALGRRRP